MRQVLFSFFIIALVTSAHAQTGKVGINTIHPAAMLHVKDSSVLFTAPSVLPISPGIPPVTGAGHRMMWYADKAAFRSGGAVNTEWDRDSIGIYSMATGQQVKAIGVYSVAMGNSTNALSTSDVAMGSFTTASGGSSAAFGNGSLAAGYSAVATGNNTSATGASAFTAGSQTMATANNATALGHFTEARSFAALAIGRFNEVDIGISDPVNWVGGDALFMVGNGTSLGNRKNAMTILKNGKVGIGTSNPVELLEVNGNILTDTVRANRLQLYNGAAAGRVLQSDADGNATWVTTTSLAISENDPKVLSSLQHAIPRWNGTALTNGVIRDDATNIGIGTAPLPGNKLTVNGKTATTSFQLTNGAAANRVLQSDIDGNATWVNSTSLAVTESDPKVLSSLGNYIPRWNGTALINGVIQDDGTNIGIGTAPGASNRLTVNGKIAVNSLQIITGAGTNRVLQSDALGNASWVNSTSLSITESDPQVQSTTEDFVPRWNGTALVNGIIQDDATNVGIGTIPVLGNKLSVNGKTATTNFQMTNGALNGYILRCDGSGNASWVSSSIFNVPESDPSVLVSVLNAVPRWNGTSLVNGLIRDDGINGIGIGVPPELNARLKVGGKTVTTSLQITGSAGLNKVLVSDADGNGSWDNNLDLFVVNASQMNATRFNASTFAYQTPKTRNLSLPAAAFQLMPVNGTSTAGINSTTISGGQTLVSGTAGVAAFFEAPVYLPAGAIITGISLNVRDASGTYEVSAELVSVSSFLPSVLASVPGTGAAANFGDTNIAVTGLNIVVNELRNYFLRFNTIEFNGNLRIYNARITYTVDEAD